MDSVSWAPFPATLSFPFLYTRGKDEALGTRTSLGGNGSTVGKPRGLARPGDPHGQPAVPWPPQASVGSGSPSTARQRCLNDN